MRKASTRLLEQGIQAPSPAPDLIPAETSTENLHWDRYIGRGHFTTVLSQTHGLVNETWPSIPKRRRKSAREIVNTELGVAFDFHAGSRL
jgi:hypothetical protein